MKAKVLMILALTFVLIFTITGAASASDVTVSNDKTSFLNNTGATEVPFPTDATVLGNQPFGGSYIDYSCTDGAVGITLNDLVTVRAVNNNWICFFGPEWNGGTGNINPTPLTPTIVVNREDDYHVVEFSKPVTAIAFELLTNTYAQETVTVQYSDGTSEAIDISSNTVPNEFDFVGLSFAKSITSLTLDTTGGASQNEGIAGIWLATDNAGPLTTNVVATPNPVAVGGSVELTANVDDSTTGGSTIASAEYSLEGGAWTSMDAVNTPFDAISEDVAVTFTAPATAGIYNLCVRGTDAGDNIGPAECIMLVVYDPDGGFVTGGGWIDSPADAMDPMSMLVWDQGFEVDTSGWFDNDDYSGYGYISASDGVATVEGYEDACPTWVPNPPTSCFYGPFSRFDGYRDTWPGDWIAEIDVYLDPTWATGSGFDYSVAASGSDGSHQRDYIFHVGVVENYGSVTGKALLVNGSNNSDYYPNPYKLVNENGGNYYEVTTAGWYTLQHLFYDAGGYLAVDLKLLDDAGNVVWTATRSNTIDTIPGEVGGNRYALFTHVAVDGGIQVDNHQLEIPVSVTGKANFGFVAKYKKGATVPDGNTQFQFQAGDLNFHSSSYEWLVVTGSNYAKFKGEGTINDQAAPTGDNYKFQIWAGDGDPDTFRIKIWYEDGGNEVVVYENEPDQPIAGGSIKVHAPK